MLRMFLSSSLVVLFSLLASAAHACSGPAGSEGEIIYNLDHKVVQFCNGTAWVGMGGGTDITTANLNELADVNAGSPTDGQVLTWDNGTSRWISADGSASYQIPDDASVCNAGTDGTIRYNSNKLQLCVDGTGWTDVAGSGVTNGKFVDGTDPNEAVYTTGNVGIGTNDPTTALTVIGDTTTTSLIVSGASGLPAPTTSAQTWQVPDDAGTCDADTDGTIRYNSSTLQLCVNGTGWLDVTVSGGGGGGGGGNVYNYSSPPASYTVGDIILFPYVGAQQTFDTENATSIRVSLWGAKGGDLIDDGDDVEGGRGGMLKVI